MLIADFVQLSPKSNRQKLLFITFLQYQTYWVTNTSIVPSYVTGNKSPQGRYCTKLAQYILTNRNRQGIYYRKSDIPIIGIIVTYHSTTYFKVFLHNFNNNSQQDALFLKLILLKNSTCLGQTYFPSSGVLILSASEVRVTPLADSQHNRYEKYQLLWIQY
jgi:hypothetical protein